MKFLILLIALLAGLFFACRNTSEHRDLIAQRQQLLAGVTVQEAPLQPQAIYTVAWGRSNS